MSDAPTEELSPLKRALVEIRDLKSRLSTAEQRSSAPIAIVGMGLRLPGGVHDSASYWDLLHEGIDAISEVPDDRWAVDDLYDPDPDVAGRMATRWGGWLDRIDEFDANFFGMSPREAENTDPQQRLLLEIAWEALEDANIPPDQLFDTQTGVFLGIANSDYMRLLTDDPAAIDTYTITGNALSTAAGRISYVLGAQGPAMSIDTACSASLVAVHLAVRSLRDRECDVALAGGVNLMLAPEPTIGLSRARTMAPDGRCKTFDARADGIVRSEGCAMIAVKRLDDAIADGDRVLAVIRGSAVNQDGRSGGLTAPNGPSQENVIRSALADGGVAPHAVGYVEAHGTGTSLGDPIEIGALGNALCTGRPPSQPLTIGSVKTNIGHTESVAGVAGLIKTVLMMQHREIPPHLHLEEVSPHIAARALPIDFPRAPRPWTETDGELIAGVSSFGLSGTNAHVIIAEAPAVAPSEHPGDADPAGGRDIVTLSAKNPAALSELARRTADRLRNQGSVALADLARSTNLGRTHLDHRLAIVATSTSEVVSALDGFDDDATDADGLVLTDPSAGAPSPAGVAFLFTGHGSQYPRMGRALYATEPVFAAAFDRCDDHVRERLGASLHDILFSGDDALAGQATAQPALFALQFALSELWASWGVRPTVVAGHSAGEYVAAVLAGVFSVEDGLDIICARGRLIASLPPGGEMVAVFAGEDVVAPVVARHSLGASVASVNGPESTVVSGSAEAVAAVIAELDLDDDETRRLPVDAAGHSPLFDPILDEFTSVVARVSLSAPTLGLVSSMTGDFVRDEVTDPQYWRRHLRETVRFADVFDTLRAAESNVFVELGPDATLLKLGRRNWPDASGTWIPTMGPNGDEQAHALGALASLHVAGVGIDWEAFARSRSGRSGRPVSLEPYPWQHRSYWSPAIGVPRSAPTTPMWPATVEAARHQATQGPLNLDIATYSERWELLDRLATAFIARTLTDLGLFTAAGDGIVAAELFADGRLVDGYEHLGTRWLDHLALDGLLVRDGDRYVSPEPLPSVVDDDLVAAARTAFVGIEAILDYVLRCGDHLTAVVSGNETGLNTLFPDGSYETVDYMYNEWPVAHYFNSIVRAAASAAGSTRRGQPFRVLEVGAGTGGTTATVLPSLPTDGIEYTLTDVSEFFLTRAAERFSEYPAVAYSLLDIERPPTEQGYPEQGFDIVIAANVLHATRDLDATLRHVASLLAPGGSLIAFESTHHPRWFDVTTGLIEGWQRFDDSWRTDVPLVDTDTWRAALAAAGFETVEAFPGDDAATSLLLQQVILARAPGDEAVASRNRRPSVTDTDGEAATSAEIGAIIDVGIGVRERLNDALADEREGVIVDAVRLSIAHVLRLTDPSELRRDEPLLDLGFDSLMAVELRNVLRQSFELEKKLPATLAFDHPTIGAIARYLDGLLSGSDTSAPTPEPTGASVDRAPVGPGLDEADVAELSDAEAEERLLAKLEELEA